MGSQRPRPVVLDAGALIAFERLDRRMVRLLELAEDVYVPGGVLAQVWRNPARQVRLVRLLGADGVRIAALDGEEARAVGQLCAATGTSDVVDASVVLLAHRVGGVPVSSDVADLHRIDPHLEVVEC
ncbi:MAG: PIN domain-containing protein [Sporichthyaceae bacterium]